MLFLVRHGRTSLNRSHKLQGRIDLPLDEFGDKQAKAIGNPVTVDDQWIELDLRVRTAIEDIYERAKTENIAIVSHVSPIKAAIAWSMGATIGASWRCLLDPASISIINIRSHGPAMYSFNNKAHLIGI